MQYFKYENDQNTAINKWDKSQFDLADIVLSLTDNNISYGSKIYAIFSRHEILSLFQRFSFDFNKVKENLGIYGDYVEREGNIYSTNFNPRRNSKALTLTRQEMEDQAREICSNIFKDLIEIIYKLEKFSEN